MTKKKQTENLSPTKLKNWITEAEDDNLGFVYNMIADEMEERELFDSEADIPTETFKSFLLKAKDKDIKEFFDLIRDEADKRGLG